MPIISGMGRVLLVGLLMLTVSACMPKVEEDEVIPLVTLDSHSISGSTSADMKIMLTGTCPEGTYMIRVMVGSVEHSVANTTAASQSNSGVPTASCTNKVLSIEYPVPNPTVSRAILFKVKARLADGRSTLEWAVRTVNYTPPSPGIPGFAITSVGGISSEAVAFTVHGSGGEPVGGPNELASGGGPTLRSGLHGVLLE